MTLSHSMASAPSAVQLCKKLYYNESGYKIEHRRLTFMNMSYMYYMSLIIVLTPLAYYTCNTHPVSETRVTLIIDP